MKKLLLLLVILLAVDLFSQSTVGGFIEIDAIGNVNIGGAFTAGSGSCSQNITATLHVSPDGDGTDGKNWTTAYQTIQSALDAASTDANDLTLIMVAPHATYYDIDTTDDPTWTGNYEIAGTHRIWSAIRNEHSDATSIFKFTGKVSLTNLALFSTDNSIGGSVGGVIFTNSGYRVRKCGFNSEATTHANTSIHIDGASAVAGFIRGGIIEDIQIQGAVGTTRGIYFDTAKVNEAKDMSVHNCLTGIQITNATSDYNEFHSVDLGDCALGLDIDAGNGQHFNHVNFHHNTVNIDDEVGDHTWEQIHGQFSIAVAPDNFTGIEVDTGDGADTWSGLVTVYTNGGGAPFRIIATHTDVGTTEWYRLKFTADDTDDVVDNGETYYDDLMFDANKREGSAAPSGTEFIFNKGTVIKARSKSVSDGVDGLDVWIEIQEIK
jgi:hypothetical protein